MAGRIGILAYGSLISDPGDDIRSATIDTMNGIVTPFKVEFARSSRSRKGAPTLVPVEDGGAQVNAVIFVLNVSQEEARNRLWRRETRITDVTRVYKEAKNPTVNTVVIEPLTHFKEMGVDIVLSTRIGANIADLTPQSLAALAIESAQALNNGRDGISYLMRAKENGVRTLLSVPYEEEIKRKLDAADLEEALRKARAKAKG
jgi:cation transport regulator ChaC